MQTARIASPTPLDAAPPQTQTRGESRSEDPGAFGRALAEASTGRDKPVNGAAKDKDEKSGKADNAAAPGIQKAILANHDRPQPAAATTGTATAVDPTLAAQVARWESGDMPEGSDSPIAHDEVSDPADARVPIEAATAPPVDTALLPASVDALAWPLAASPTTASTRSLTTEAAPSMALATPVTAESVAAAAPVAVGYVAAPPVTAGAVAAAAVTIPVLPSASRHSAIESETQPGASARAGLGLAPGDQPLVDVGDLGRFAGSSGQEQASSRHDAPANPNTLPAALHLSAAAGAPIYASAAAAAPQLTEAQLPARPGSPEFAPMLGAQLSILARKGVSEARLHLNPAEMGPISVQITLSGQTALVNLAAEHAFTRQMLEQAMPTLASALRESGLTLAGGGVFEQPQSARQPQDGSGQSGTAHGSLSADDSQAIEPGALRRPSAPRGVVDLYA